MLTTKAYITKVPEPGDNIFNVNIPLMADNVNDEAIFEALLCSTSGNYNDYKVGDCVFVDFEDDKYNTAIIMGKLYTEVPKENDAYGLFNELKVTGSVTLPENTTIGKYSPQDIFNLYQAVSNFQLPSLEDLADFDDLKAFTSKEEFNSFFGDNYFNNEFPYDVEYEFKNEIESNESALNKRTGKTDYNPDYSTLKNDGKTFIQTGLNKILGIGNKSANEPYSISQTIYKMSQTDSQTFNVENLEEGKSPIVKDKYYPTYDTLIKNLNDFFSASGGYVKYDPTDTSPGPGKKVRIMSGSNYDSLKSASKLEANTIYFLTSLSSSD